MSVRRDVGQKNLKSSFSPVRLYQIVHFELEMNRGKSYQSLSNSIYKLERLVQYTCIYMPFIQLKLKIRNTFVTVPNFVNRNYQKKLAAFYG